jgi:hypothetical protein
MSHQFGKRDKLQLIYLGTNIIKSRENIRDAAKLLKAKDSPPAKDPKLSLSGMFAHQLMEAGRWGFECYCVCV